MQHPTREADFNPQRLIPLAQRRSAAGPKAPILARLDSGFDSGFDPAALMDFWRALVRASGFRPAR